MTNLVMLFSLDLPKFLMPSKNACPNGAATRMTTKRKMAAAQRKACRKRKKRSCWTPQRGSVMRASLIPPLP
jgi:hypothetical protein